jgi:hypothetical protein
LLERLGEVAAVVGQDGNDEADCRDLRHRPGGPILGGSGAGRIAGRGWFVTHILFLAHVTRESQGVFSTKTHRTINF